MSSVAALRTCMQAIVFLNLVFVQLTGAAGWHWLGPLFALTLAEPWLRRMRETVVYRVLWNGGVVAFFFVLLRHAMQAELAYVLEDGLVLAVLCQVHLLNNLSTDQRPDLLFFNAFLVAMITGFMTRGIGFPVAFLVFVPCYVIGLQLQSATRDGHAPAPEATRRLMVDATRRGAFVLLASLFVFLFWPRDFERKALFRGNFEFPAGGPGNVGIGYNEEVIHTLRQNVPSANRRALELELLDGDPATLPTLWRGAVLGVTDGRSWRPAAPGQGNAGAGGTFWRVVPRGLAQDLPAEGPRARIGVVRLEQETERLFAPLGAFELRLASEHYGALLRAQSDGTIDVSRTGDVAYELQVAVRAPALGGEVVRPAPEELAHLVELPGKARDFEPVLELAARLAAELAPDVEQHELVSHFREAVERRYRYVAPGTDGAAGTLTELLGGKPGHCELFASALAVMLRGQGVPCRLVTGFRAEEWTSNTLTVGTRNAHAWVEVHDPRGGWYAVDPSPPSADGAFSGGGLWARFQERARIFWSSVTGFDSQRRAAAVAWVRALPAKTLAFLRSSPFLAAATVLLSGALLLIELRRRRPRTPREVREYSRVLRRRDLRLEEGETPRELLDRARSLDLEPECLSDLERVTREHELARYGT